jgi:hypothetical protein
MNYQQVKQKQARNGVEWMQNAINSGLAWKLEGSVGRQAMEYLEIGVCMLPKVAKFDYYGNRVPSRDEVKAGTKGSYALCREYWMNFNELTDEL